MSRLGEITNLPLSKPIDIQQIGFAWQGQAVVISISQILVSGGYCDFPCFIQILQSAHLRSCQLNSNPICILFFLVGSIFNWNYILYTSFFIYTFKSTTPFIHKYGLKWHDLRFIRLYPSIWIFKYLKPLYVEIQCMHSSLTVSN